MFTRGSKFVLPVLMILSLCSLAQATTRSTGMTRPEIRTLPIQERPNRPGHFYGNTVRGRGAPRR